MTEADRVWLTEEVGKLHMLLNDPQPGLWTYQRVLHYQVEKIAEWWLAQKVAPAPPDVKSSRTP